VLGIPTFSARDIYGTERLVARARHLGVAYLEANQTHNKEERRQTHLTRELGEVD
jgi:hypothetical protein